MKTLEQIGMITIPETKSRQDHIDKYGEQSNSCICCGRLTKAKYYINTVEGPDAIKADVTDEDLAALDLYSQGVFMVGSECRKLFPEGYVTEVKQ